ncbi:AAA family ATPase [Corynebacterium glutamicum]|uniref:AAA family ATPase n=1 Tax=Corynebacterium glutamicum TaxID=1718 RepID=UPI000A4CC8BC|nr:AAA family ATPase [Corynebacterium glutamicum]
MRVDHHPEILELFDRMVSGRFVEIDGAFKLAPDGAESHTPMTSTFSTVRVLFESGEFLRHRAQEDQWLIIDEPELNLHPQNQVLMGRLLAALSHEGLKILATTPSDYIVRELSILVILSQKTSQHCLLVTLQSMF